MTKKILSRINLKRWASIGFTYSRNSPPSAASSKGDTNEFYRNGCLEKLDHNVLILGAGRNKIESRLSACWPGLDARKKQLLIDSILNDYDIPKIYFHDLEDFPGNVGGFTYAVIDGRQRLETIWDFMDGKFPLAKEFEYQKDDKTDLAGLYYNDIATQHPKIRIRLDSFVLPVVLVKTSDGDIDLIEDMFSRLNEAVPLNAAEKRNAIGGEFVRAIRRVSEQPFFCAKCEVLEQAIPA